MAGAFVAGAFVMPPESHAPSHIALGKKKGEGLPLRPPTSPPPCFQHYKSSVTQDTQTRKSCYREIFYYVKKEHQVFFCLKSIKPTYMLYMYMLYLLIRKRYASIYFRLSLQRG